MEILNKSSKNYYILLSGDLYAGIGNAAFCNIVEIL
jgi:hypothetical protein